MKEIIRRPNRLRHKKQITVRLDERLIEMAKLSAAKHGCYITDVIERGVWKWLVEDEKQGQPSFQLRYLVERAPLELRQVTEGFLGFCGSKQSDEVQEHLRRYLLSFCQRYRQTPECRANLEKVGNEGQS